VVGSCDNSIELSGSMKGRTCFDQLSDSFSRTLLYGVAFIISFILYLRLQLFWRADGCLLCHVGSRFDNASQCI